MTSAAVAPLSPARSAAVVLGGAAIGAALLATTLVYEVGGPSRGLAIAAGALFVIIGLYMWHLSQVHFLLLLPFYFGYLTAVVSNVYLEHGAYITEEQRYSFATGSTLRLTLYSGLYLLAMFFTLYRFASRESLRALAVAAMQRPGVRLLTSSIMAMVVAWLALLLASGLVFNFPIFLRIDRYTYWTSHPFPYLWRILIQGTQLAFLLGITYGAMEDGPRRRLALSLFVLMLLTNVLFGDKFSSSALSLMNFGAGASVMRQLVHGEAIRLGKWIPRALVAIGVFFFLVSWSYREISNIASQEVVDYIVSRVFGLQGHTWWGIDLLAQGNADGPGAQALLRRHSPLAPGGLYLLMYAVAPADAVAFYMSKGMTFTMGGTAIAVYTLGYPLGFLYMIAAGGSAGLILSYVARKAASVHLWRTWIALKVAWIALLAFNMGNVYLLLSASMVIYLAIIAADLLRQLLSAPRVIPALTPAS